MKIAFFGLTDPQKIEFYTHHLQDNHELFFIEECLDKTVLPEKKDDIEMVSIFVHCKASKEILEQFPNLKMIAVRSTGFDNVDLEYAKSKNITVCNVPSYGSHTVAEYAFALLLTISRNTFQALTQSKDGNFSQQGLRGFDLFGKTIGIIGTGKIGANAIRIAKGFGMNVLAYDVYRNNDLAKELDFTYVELDELLRNSDIVSLHAPATAETHHILNHDSIFKMKKGGVVINTARGALVETTALLKALKENHLRAAGIDVLEEENQLTGEQQEKSDGYEAAKELITLPNVYYSPHLAFFSKEAEENIMEVTIDNITHFVENAPINIVNK